MSAKSYSIGQRTKFSRSSKQIEVSISQRVLTWQEALIFAWLLSWLLCGVFFVIEMVSANENTVRTFMAVVLGFWGYFMVRGIKIFLWRRIGKEEMVISAGKLSLRNALGNYGKWQHMDIDGILKPGLIKTGEHNFFRFMESAFWSMGGETIGFQYGKKRMILGKQLSERDARDLLRLLEGGMKDFSKKV